MFLFVSFQVIVVGESLWREKVKSWLNVGLRKAAKESQVTTSL